MANLPPITEEIIAETFPSEAILIRREMRELERRFQGWAQTLEDKLRIQEIAINFMVKEPELLVDRVLNKFREEKNGKDK